MKFIKFLFIALLLNCNSCKSIFSQSKNPFIGNWTGSYSCYPQGEKGITVEVKSSGGKLIVTSYTYPLPSNPDLPIAIIEADGYISKNKLFMKNPRWIKKYKWATLGEAAPIEYVGKRDYLYYKVCGNPVALFRKETGDSYTEKGNFEKLPSYYDRTSLSILFLDFGDPNTILLKSVAKNIEFPQKYDYNKLNNTFLRPSFRRPSYTVNLQELIFMELDKLEIGKKILAEWYNRDPDGIMNMSTIHNRGRFTATDQAFINSQTLARKDAALYDYGERLINLSYILVIDLQNVKKNPKSTGNNIEWQADAVGYIFRLNFTDHAKTILYQSWINDNDSRSIRDQKNMVFDSIYIPVTFVDKFVIEEIQNRKDLNQSSDLKTIVDVAIRELIQKAETMIGDFRVKSPIYSTKPLRSKIGLKEGIKTDDRFFVYEHKIEPSSGVMNIERVGVVRATSSIADNRHDAVGNMKTTKFYQVAGKRLKEGQIIQQKNDIGLETSFLKGYGEMSGFNVRFDYRISNMINLKSTFILMEFGFQSKQYPQITNLLGYSNSKFNFFQLEQGFAKGIQIHRNLELRPFINYGFEFTNNEEFPDEYNVGAFFLKPGINANFNLAHYFQFIIGYSNYSPLGWFLDNNDNEVMPWNELFEGRKGSVFSVGVKISM
jgi:hypothetical protein